nr:Smr/MutS family protein [Pontixanthobacter sp. CEM42]
MTAEEEAAWVHLASSVEPMDGRELPRLSENAETATKTPRKFVKTTKRVQPAPPKFPPVQQSPRPPHRIGHASLDSHWDKKLKAGSIAPDYTLDLHDHFVDAAYERLDRGMRQAKAMDARLVLVITGRPRPVEAADRANKRGVIRAKILDWLAAGDHADSIAAVRKAHRKHGGEGALYIVLRRNR